MVRYSSGIDKTHALIFLVKLNMIRKVFIFLNGEVDFFGGFYIQMWLSW